MATPLTDSIALPLPAELEILEILWCRQSATARELHGVLVARRVVSYRVVKTTLAIMLGKGLVEKHFLGIPVSYQASYSKNELQQLVLGQLADALFHDDLASLLRTVLSHPKFQGDRQLLHPKTLPSPEKELN